MVTMPTTPEAVRAHSEVRSMPTGMPENLFARGGLPEHLVPQVRSEGCGDPAAGPPRGRLERMRRAVGLASPPRWCL